MIAVYTATFGGYDQPKPLPEGLEADAYFMSEDEHLLAEASELGWTSIYADSRYRDEHPRLRAKRPKCLGLSLEEYDWTIWIDASHEILKPSFPTEAVKWVEANHTGLPLGFYRHPWRSDLWAEALESQHNPKYADCIQELQAQVGNYNLELADDVVKGWAPTAWSRLWATGTIVRKVGDELVDEVMSDWWGEIQKTTIQDQVSLPAVLARISVGLRTNYLPCPLPHHQVIDNPWTTIRPHADRT